MKDKKKGASSFVGTKTDTAKGRTSQRGKAAVSRLNKEIKKKK